MEIKMLIAVIEDALETLNAIEEMDKLQQETEGLEADRQLGNEIRAFLLTL